MTLDELELAVGSILVGQCERCVVVEGIDERPMNSAEST